MLYDLLTTYTVLLMIKAVVLPLIFLLLLWKMQR